MLKIIIFIGILKLISCKELPVSSEDAAIELIRENRNLIILFRELFVIEY